MTEPRGPYAVYVRLHYTQHYSDGHTSIYREASAKPSELGIPFPDTVPGRAEADRVAAELDAYLAAHPEVTDPYLMEEFL